MTQFILTLLLGTFLTIGSLPAQNKVPANNQRDTLVRQDLKKESIQKIDPTQKGVNDAKSNATQKNETKIEVREIRKPDAKPNGKPRR